eukprot:GHVR01103499.1.p1 GENE.GHVR01103499.1~~GHVR01103499.1.p1  ORF type:complete len:102 (+),score=3.80 GHVR01103499.1:525-830(+)
MSNMTSFLTERRYIYIIGGFSEDVNNLIRLNLNTVIWEQVSSLSSNRSKFGAISHNKEIFIFGGKKGKERVADSDIFNCTTGKWFKCEPMKKSKEWFWNSH